MMLQFSDWYVKQRQIPQARTSRLKYQWIYLLFRRYGTKYSSVLGLKGFHSISFFCSETVFSLKRKKNITIGCFVHDNKILPREVFLMNFIRLFNFKPLHKFVRITQHLSKNIYFTSWMFSSLFLKLRKELVSPVLGELKLKSRF